MLRRAEGVAASALVAALALTSCSGADDVPSSDRTAVAAADATGSTGSDGSSGPSASSGSSDGSSPSPSTHVEVPDGVTLTDVGTELSFGETARVAYEVTRKVAPKDPRAKGGKGTKPEPKKPGKPKKVTVGTVLGLTVESATKGTLDDLAGFDLRSDYERKANYYYVRVRVKNLGERRFGDVEVPLYGISGDNRLLPPVRFSSAFATCPTQLLPPGFAPGARLRTCLVFLSPDKGSLVGISYRPTETSTSIEWRGKVAKPVDRTERGKKRKGS